MVSGNGRATCPFYDKLDAILGTRAASCPPVVLESGGSGAGAGSLTEPEPLTDTATVENGDEGMFLDNFYPVLFIIFMKYLTDTSAPCEGSEGSPGVDDGSESTSHELTPSSSSTSSNIRRWRR